MRASGGSQQRIDNKRCVDAPTRRVVRKTGVSAHRKTCHRDPDVQQYQTSRQRTEFASRIPGSADARPHASAMKLPTDPPTTAEWKGKSRPRGRLLDLSCRPSSEIKAWPS